MNKLPNVFANPITKKMNNYQDSYRSSNKEIIYNQKEINKKINEIFSSNNHVYKSKVKITLSNEIIETQLVGKTNIHLLTLDGKLIKITDILNIEKVY